MRNMLAVATVLLIGLSVPAWAQARIFECRITASASPLSHLGELKPGGFSEMWLRDQGHLMRFDESTGVLYWGVTKIRTFEIMPSPVKEGNDLVAVRQVVGTGGLVHDVLIIRTWDGSPMSFLFLHDRDILSGHCFVANK